MSILAVLDEPKVDENIHTFTDIDHKIPFPIKYYTTPYNKIRRAKLLLFEACLNFYKEYCALTVNERMALINDIEKSCMNYTIRHATNNNIIPSWNTELFENLYHMICYKISANIKPDGLVQGNNGFARKVITRKLNIKELPKMASCDIYPELYEEIIDRIDASKKINKSVKVSTMYICGKCKSNKCTYQIIQSRSLDEGSTISVTCTNCNNKFNG